MDLKTSIAIAASGLKAQSGRMRVIAENLANANSTANGPDGEPFRRRLVSFQSVYSRALGAHEVRLGRVQFDQSDFVRRYEPGHPAADENGYVEMPNVNPMIEMMDMRQAQRSYEANLKVIESSRAMLQRTIDILR